VGVARAEGLRAARREAGAVSKETCPGCNGYHGSDGRWRRCVSDALAQARETLRHAKIRIEELEKKIAGAKRYLG